MTTDIAMTAVLVGQRERDGWGHNLWHITLTRDGETMTTEFCMGLGLVDPPKRKTWGRPTRSDEFPTPRVPTLHEVLQSLAYDARCVVDDEWDGIVDGLPYRKAKAIVDACEAETVELRRLLGRTFTAFIEHEWED